MKYLILRVFTTDEYCELRPDWAVLPLTVGMIEYLTAKVELVTELSTKWLFYQMTFLNEALWWVNEPTRFEDEPYDMEAQPWFSILEDKNWAVLRYEEMPPAWLKEGYYYDDTGHRFLTDSDVLAVFSEPSGYFKWYTNMKNSSTDLFTKMVSLPDILDAIEDKDATEAKDDQ